MRFIPLTFMNSEQIETLNVEYLVVAAGGAGGFDIGAGGGGAGGFLSGSQNLLANTIYNIQVGSGSIYNGQDSKIYNEFLDITAIGGGFGGGSISLYPQPGGSGGGGGFESGIIPMQGAAGISPQGNDGGDAVSMGLTNGGGGGGASQNGEDAYQQVIGGTTEYFAGDGGDGKQWLDGNYYAGGGGGSIETLGWPTSSVHEGLGGIGGGGKGEGLTPQTTGSANTGGGGGGSQTILSPSIGGSGIVKIRYEGHTVLATGGDNIFVSGGYVYHEFTSTGSSQFEITGSIYSEWYVTSIPTYTCTYYRAENVVVGSFSPGVSYTKCDGTSGNTGAMPYGSVEFFCARTGQYIDPPYVVIGLGGSSPSCPTGSQEDGYTNSTEACNGGLVSQILYTSAQYNNTTSFNTGSTIFYTDPELTIPYDGKNYYFGINNQNNSNPIGFVQIDSSGYLISNGTCP